MEQEPPATSIGTALKRVESTQYPASHAGHLSEDQQKALDDFKSICAKENYYTAANGEKGPSHDDPTLLRYLRARRFVASDAFKQFKDTEDWRKKTKLDEVYDTVDVTEYEESRRLYPQWTGRRDKRGLPLYIFQVRHLTAKRMEKYDKFLAKANPKSDQTTSPKLLRLFALYENLLRFTMPLCSAAQDRPFFETPVTQSNNLVDISGVGIKQFWNLRAHMQDASQLATAHYPETLDRIFIVGAPSFFPTVWGWIKRWFDPITVSKIFILSQHDAQKTLEQFIDSESIPEDYGGKLKWHFGDQPNLDPAFLKILDWQNPSKNDKGENCFPIGPVKFEENAVGGLSGHAVGSIAGKLRNEIVATLPTQMTKSNVPNMTLEIPTPGITEGAPLTGDHTHPEEGQSYFPSSGNTPPSEPEEPQIPGNATPIKKQEQPSKGIPADPSKFEVPLMAMDQALPREPKSSANGQREGTSLTRFEQQNATLAAGQLADGTPETIDYGNGDLTRTREPRTVGQACKDIDVPEKEPPAPSYIEQVRAVAGSAINTTTTTLAAAGSTALAAVGLGTKATSAADEEAKTEEKQHPQSHEDQQINDMKNNKVEEFIRPQYTSEKGAQVEQHRKQVAAESS